MSSPIHSSDSDSSLGVHTNRKRKALGDVEILSGPRKRKPSTKLRDFDELAPNDDSGSNSPRPAIPKTTSRKPQARPRARRKHGKRLSVQDLDVEDDEDMPSPPSSPFPPSPTAPELATPHDAVLSVSPYALRSVLTCSVCNGVLRNCHVLSHCMHKLCAGCVDEVVAAGKCRACGHRISQENRPVDDAFFESLVRMVYPLAHAVANGVRHTWGALSHPGDTLGALCLKYDVDRWSMENASSAPETPKSKPRTKGDKPSKRSGAKTPTPRPSSAPGAASSEPSPSKATSSGVGLEPGARDPNDTTPLARLMSKFMTTARPTPISHSMVVATMRSPAEAQHPPQPAPSHVGLGLVQDDVAGVGGAHQPVQPPSVPSA